MIFGGRKFWRTGDGADRMFWLIVKVKGDGEDGKEGRAREVDAGKTGTHKPSINY